MNALLYRNLCLRAIKVIEALKTGLKKYFDDIN